MEQEKRWIAAARQGDRSAFGRLVEAFQGPVYNLTYRMLGDPEEAEDAAQETFLRAYRKIDTYDPSRKFSTWLLSIASHYCIDRLRRRRLTWLSLEDEGLPHGNGGRQPQWSHHASKDSDYNCNLKNQHVNGAAGDSPPGF